MPRISLPPFLKKLQVVVNTIDSKTACWAEDGNSFVVKDSNGFEAYLRNYYKGCLLTFVRQLHFYSFRKVDIKGDRWSFWHKCFKRDSPHLIYEIKRKTRQDANDGVASQTEVQSLRTHVVKMEDAMKRMQEKMMEMENTILELKRSHTELQVRIPFSNNAYSAPNRCNGVNQVIAYSNKVSVQERGENKKRKLNGNIKGSKNNKINKMPEEYGIDFESVGGGLLQYQYEDGLIANEFLPFADSSIYNQRGAVISSQPERFTTLQC
uniref:HSF-type DNA-binding domain-containing protein n=1 Tax=Aplanochytrium stocchinoi TaxID=215587 RepID=A0A7S3PQI5_9STRA|mmetsp:Transcript_20363/g.24672  ORF Transcript_20363/g.24672 Transcript_20363/m.24672 type:complete len:266 (+) Transcript_20363:258-1055(+)|eukprot:CAMPEP_0204829234 /NCGR_PEP_ID=MMETSP1346-20131115/7318_1 /ASSEMBLY_ACC=CAM_ASM_000771 /TAXON_ID=215587 /ORGANISM="Aplanochytrium stocchinoi, Strain GSBS06" /LENGTH=265 /DNA_ID=CAMNT_0051958851 /DNA_START=143 /DNA_END=940 /DNA_ORIENTATION=+